MISFGKVFALLPKFITPKHYLIVVYCSVDILQYASQSCKGLGRRWTKYKVKTTVIVAT